MINPKWEEQILVVKRSKLFKGDKLTFQGVLLKDNDGCVTKGQHMIDVLSNDYKVMRRGNEADPTPPKNNAEINTDYKQPIPYAVIRRGSEIFTYKRLGGGGESRLFDNYSIGAGGHMNDIPAEERELIAEKIDFYTLLSHNLERELTEELYISSNERQAEIIGFINDDSNSVGEVHIGILVIVDIAEDTEVEVLETDQLQGEWKTLEQLLEKDTYDKLENWSKIVVDLLK